jgi:soluble lytic murein transglycosylase-like protein
MSALLNVVAVVLVISGSVTVIKRSDGGSDALTLRRIDKIERSIESVIAEMSTAYRIPPEVALAVAEQESGFDQRKRGKSGEIGVMQLMPNTAKEMGANPHTAEGNIKAGLKYLRLCWDMHGKDMLRCYNGGIGWNKVKDPARKALIARNTAIYDQKVKARMRKGYPTVLRPNQG